MILEEFSMVKEKLDNRPNYTCPVCFRTRKDNGKWCLYCGCPHEFESEQHRQQWEEEHKIENYPPGVIICGNCGKRAFLGALGLCNLCYAKIHNRSYRRKYPGKVRDSRLKYEFGITKKEYDSMLVRQGGGCGICGRTKQKSGRALAVDHDHNTGEIRGILCGNCNLMLGYAQDSTEILQRAIDYLTGVEEE